METVFPDLLPGSGHEIHVSLVVPGQDGLAGEGDVEAGVPVLPVVRAEEGVALVAHKVADLHLAVDRAGVEPAVVLLVELHAEQGASRASTCSRISCRNYRNKSEKVQGLSLTFVEGLELVGLVVPQEEVAPLGADGGQGGKSGMPRDGRRPCLKKK